MVMPSSKFNKVDDINLRSM